MNVGGGDEAAGAGVVLPFLEELGHRWETGELSVGHERLAGNLVRHRLGALTLDVKYDDASSVAVLACPSGEAAVGVPVDDRGFL